MEKSAYLILVTESREGLLSHRRARTTQHTNPYRFQRGQTAHHGERETSRPIMYKQVIEGAPGRTSQSLLGPLGLLRSVGSFVGKWNARFSGLA